MASSSRIADDVMMGLSAFCGGGSILLLVAGRLELVPMGLGETGTLGWDALLSVAFFLQHSVMVRRPVKERLARAVPERYVGALYSIASGVVLTLVLVLWQRSPGVLLVVEGPFRWALHALAALAAAGFVWGVLSLPGFDPLGLGPIRAHRSGRPSRASPFMVRGAYRWVRHPLYGSIIVLFWADPVVTADHLLFAALWTAWIIVGTVLEERDLVAEFGSPYADYQRKVPMLIPWHGPRSSR